jgi:hypothetical protein
MIDRRTFIKILGAVGACATPLVSNESRASVGGVLKNIYRCENFPAGGFNEFWMVRFDCKQHHLEEDFVRMSFNGFSLDIKRGVNVVIPVEFCDIADHADYYNRNECSWILIYPYTKIRTATRQEFERQFV